MKWAPSISVLGAALTAALLVVAIAGAVAHPSRATVVTVLVGVTAAPVSAYLGYLVVRRAGVPVVGLLLSAFAVTLAFTVAKENAWQVLARYPADAQATAWLVALLSESAVWLLVIVLLVLLTFPDGRLPGTRWRRVPWLLVGAAALHHAYGAVDPKSFRPPLDSLVRPFGQPPVAIEALAALADVLLVALLVACVAAPLLRFRRASALERRQLTWLILAGLSLPVFLLTCGAEILLTGEPRAASLVIGIVCLVGIPASIALAILRHDLYDVDRALSTTVAYALATAALAAAIVAVAIATGLAFGRGSTVGAIAATAVCAVALSPLRRRLQTRVDRRLYPVRSGALGAIETLHREIRLGQARPEDLERRLRAPLRDAGLRVGYLTPGTSTLTDTYGRPLDATGSIPVNAGDTVVGALLPTSANVSQPLLHEVASASATLVELVALRLELAAAFRDVEASRARLVQVGDEERRRLERDLHDGAQQRLVSLGMALRIAQRHLDDGSIDLHGLIDEAVEEITAAVAELRQIAHGLRPSTLDDGLRGALTALTERTPVPVELHVTHEPLPDDVTTTAYYVVSEAVANALKHAAATRIVVRVSRFDDGVEINVSDDGCGGAVVGAGSGLTGLDDRVSALGGRLSLVSDAARGTVVEATMPCAS